MKVCMPVKADQGIESRVHGHFRSAPLYVMFDSESGELQIVINDKKQHEHGSCDALSSFSDEKPDIFVVGGIGGGALSSLRNAGVRVYKAEGTTVKDNIEALTTKGLLEFAEKHACGGHHHSTSHSHQQHACQCQSNHSHQSQGGGGCCH